MCVSEAPNPEERRDGGEWRMKEPIIEGSKGRRRRCMGVPAQPWKGEGKNEKSTLSLSLSLSGGIACGSPLQLKKTLKKNELAPRRWKSFFSCPCSLSHLCCTHDYWIRYLPSVIRGQSNLFCVLAC